MDPISIVGAIGSTSRVVYAVSTALYTFITSAKVIDKSLDALHKEIRGLHDMLNTVDKTIGTLGGFMNSDPGVDSILPA